VIVLVICPVSVASVDQAPEVIHFTQVDAFVRMKMMMDVANDMVEKGARGFKGAECCVQIRL
jgi:hypothetical protein